MSTVKSEDEEPPAKMEKLATEEERAEAKYEHKTVLKCWKCQPESGLELPDASADPHVQSLITGATVRSKGMGGGNCHISTPSYPSSTP